MSIANARGVPGTGGVLINGKNATCLLLTSHHVLFGDGAMVNDSVWAFLPSPKIGSGSETVYLGRAKAGQIGRVIFAEEIYFVDCGLVDITENVQVNSRLRAFVNCAAPGGIAEPEIGMPVCKYGSTTGRTQGVLVDVSYSDYPFIDGRSWQAPGQLLVQSENTDLNFLASGDSGAALLDKYGRVLGLLWGANASGQGIACPIMPALNCLGVDPAAIALLLDL